MTVNPGAPDHRPAEPTGAAGAAGDRDGEPRNPGPPAGDLRPVAADTPGGDDAADRREQGAAEGGDADERRWDR